MTARIPPNLAVRNHDLALMQTQMGPACLTATCPPRSLICLEPQLGNWGVVSLSARSRKCSVGGGFQAKSAGGRMSRLTPRMHTLREFRVQ